MFFERLWHDLRHGCRLFAKNPGFTAIAVISIAFGTGANVAIFSAADALLLRPPPVARPSELVTVGSRVTLGLSTRTVASYLDYVDIRARARSFDDLLAYTTRPVGFTTGPGAKPLVKMATIVSGNFFRVLGVEPVIGRSFRRDEDLVPGRDAVTVLSYGMWQQEFGGDPAVLGRKIHIAGVEFTIVGVAPEPFTGIDPRRVIRESAFVPLAMWTQMMNAPAVNPLAVRDFRGLTLKGRLASGVTLRQAQAELANIGKDLERAFPATNADQLLTAQTEFAIRYERNPLDSASLLILSVLSIAVLCVACANVAGLLSSRAPVRAREVALRLAIGAGRARIVRQLITESLGIAVAGGAGGLAVGYAGINLLRQYGYPTDIIAVPVMELDRRALAFSLVLAVLSAFLFGLAPAIQTTRLDLVNALKGSIGANRRPRLLGRNALVALQVALSLVMLTVMVFAVQIFQRELVAGPGFHTTRMAKLTVDTAHARYDDARSVRFFERAVADARSLPGVRSSGVTSAMPFFGNWDYPPIVLEGQARSRGQDAVHTWSSSVDEHYFDTMGIALIAGREFRSTDTAEQPRVAVVNDTFVRHYFPEGAIGRRIWIANEHPSWVEVVGVVKTTEMFYPSEPLQEAIYLPFRQEPRSNMVLVAETEADSASAVTPLSEMLQRMDPDVPVYDVQTIEAFYATRFSSIARAMLGMIGGIGLIGMTLTMVGLYGLVSYAVSRRTREIGIRIAIGASSGRVLAMVLRQGMAPACVGLVAGLVLSALTARLLPALIPVNHRYDPMTYMLMAPVLLGITLLAAFMPARRAARVDPTVALRCD